MTGQKRFFVILDEVKDLKSLKIKTRFFASLRMTMWERLGFPRRLSILGFA